MESIEKLIVISLDLGTTDSSSTIIIIRGWIEETSTECLIFCVRMNFNEQFITPGTSGSPVAFVATPFFRSLFVIRDPKPVYVMSC